MPALPEGLNPVYGFFSFNITGIFSGESVNIPLAFPHDVPAGTGYWKHVPTTDDTTPHWCQILVSDDGDRIIVITLKDGGIGGDDRAANGVIVDDGGPSLPMSEKGDLNGDNRITTGDAADRAAFGDASHSKSQSAANTTQSLTLIVTTA